MGLNDKCKDHLKVWLILSVLQDNWKIAIIFYLSGVSQRRGDTQLYLDTIRSNWSDYELILPLNHNFTISHGFIKRLISVYQRLFNKHSRPLQYLTHLRPFHPCIVLEPKRDESSGCILGCYSQKRFFLFYFPSIILRVS